MAGIQSVEISKGGVTKRVAVGSSAYDRYLSQGYTVVSGSGTNVKTESLPKTTTKTTTTTPKTTAANAPSVPYETALTSLRGGGLTGSSLAMAEASLANAYKVNPYVAPSSTQDFQTDYSRKDPEAQVVGLTSEVENARNALTEALNEQTKQWEKAQKAAQKKIDDITKQYEGTLEDVQGLTQPWQEQLEKTERDRLKVEENFFANQEAVGEMESLLTQAYGEINLMKSQTGLSSIRAPRIQKTIDDYNSRIDVLKAVVALRNDQISVAENLIDRSINAKVADINAQLGYYNEVLNFYDKQWSYAESEKSEAIQYVQRTAELKISQLQNDLEQAQATANYIKELMLDPTNAALIQDAGITMNMSVEEINAAIAKQSKIYAKRDTANSMATNGYSAISAAEAANKPGAVSIQNADGTTSWYFKEKEPETYAPPELYREWTLAGGEAGTGMTFAEYAMTNRGIAPTARDFSDPEIREILGTAGDYNDAVSIINTATSLKNKDRALEIAREMFPEKSGGGGFFSWLSAASQRGTETSSPTPGSGSAMEGYQGFNALNTDFLNTLYGGQ